MGYMNGERKKKMIQDLETTLGLLREIEGISSNLRIQTILRAIERKIAELKKEIGEL